MREQTGETHQLQEDSEQLSKLINLRAELLKKRSQVKKLSSDDFKVQRSSKPFRKERKQYHKQLKPSTEHEKSALSEEENNKLEKSRIALEKKAALYDKIKGGTDVLEDDELNQRFLVDFQEKIYNDVAEAKRQKEGKKVESANAFGPDDSESYKPKDSSEEWVEYTDNFGRTRVCQRKDVEYFKEQTSSKFNLRPSGNEEHHERWEKVEEETRTKNDVHYQDVLFDEARSHGTAFMPFSRDEEKRATQQQFLKDLSSEAKEAALSKNLQKRKRQKLMKERLAKVRQRKRLKMGLPIADDPLTTPPPSDDEDPTGKEEKEMPPTEAPSVLPSEPQEKEVHVREWDLGKPGVGAILTQEQWVESKRNVRNNEFAPPPIYACSSTSQTTYLGSMPRNQREPTQQSHRKEYPFGRQGGDHLSFPTPHREFSARMDSEGVTSVGNIDCVMKNQGKGSTAVPPPASYEYYRPSKTTKKRNFPPHARLDLESAISSGLSQLRKNQEGK